MNDNTKTAVIYYKLVALILTIAGWSFLALPVLISAASDVAVIFGVTATLVVGPVLVWPVYTNIKKLVEIYKIK